MNINVTEIHNVYNTTVIDRNENHVSFNGGNGGINERPRPEEEAAAHDRHIPPVAEQTQHIQAARGNPQLRASANMGRPPVAATAKPGEFNGRGVVLAREAGGSYTPPKRAENQGVQKITPLERPRPFILTPSAGGTGQRSQYRQPEARPEVPAAAGENGGEAESGAGEAPAAAGEGTPAASETERQ